MARRSTRTKTDLRILLVDDQQDTLMAVGRLLEREGHGVLTAASGHEALEILKNNDIHLMIVDYFMPRMNGEELIRRVRQFDPYVQIILQTGYAGEKPPRVMLKELDIQGYHDKTDDPDRLLLWVEVAHRAFRLVSSLRERERLQSELVANCSHELRTPLNVILGYAEVLRAGGSGPLSDSVGRVVQSIEGAAADLLHLVTEFLQYARMEAGVGELEPGSLSVDLFVREMTRFAGLLLEEKDVVFDVDLTHAPTEFVTDQRRLRHIVRNLLSNAAKFTKAGTVTLRIAADPDGVRVEVCDTGPGIRPEDQEVIFEPFRQLDGSSTRAHGGVGLGLAASRKQARLLGGDLVVESEPGLGATFSLLLPHATAMPGVAAEEADGFPTP